MGASQYYLTLAEFGRCPKLSYRNEWRCGGALDKGCTDIMYMTIVYPNYPIISYLTQPGGCLRCCEMLCIYDNMQKWGYNKALKILKIFLFTILVFLEAKLLY